MNRTMGMRVRSASSLFMVAFLSVGAFHASSALAQNANLLLKAAPAVSTVTKTAVATDSPGPLQTSTVEYRFQPSVDADVLPHVSTEIWARVYWPTQLADPSGKKRPLLMFLHGNHGTCGSGTNPRNDGSCQYTNEGICPAGYVVTPNHEGYNYVAEHLASWGYVVVSVNANRGITCGSGNSDDWGLILARGRLVLKHLSLWSNWNSTGGAPTEFGDPDLFKDMIDFKNVGLMGHSRGGEGVRAALNLFRDPGSIWPAKIPDLDIKAIFEIGAVDGQSTRVLDAPAVAWNQLLPLCDGDVSDLQGRNPFERMMSRYFTKSEAESRSTPKSLQMVWGANHNYFNTEWQTSDGWGCEGQPTHKPIFDGAKIESLEQQTIARQSMSGFFRAHVGPDADSSLAQQFDPSFSLPSTLSTVGPIDRDFIPAFELGKTLRVDDFTEATGKNPNGPANEAVGVTVDHQTYAEPPVARVSWEQAGVDRYFQTNFADLGAGSEVATFDFLDLRVGRILSNAAEDLKTTVDFGVALVDSADKVSNIVTVGGYTSLFGPPHGSTDLTQTVRIPLADFNGIDMSKVRGVRFVFNVTPKAAIRLAQVRFGVASEKITALPAAQPLASILEVADRLLTLNTHNHSNVALMDAQPASTTDGHLIMPENRSMTALRLPASANDAANEQRASWLRTRRVPNSKFLGGNAAVEVAVIADDSFPVMDALPVLNVENNLFPVSRYQSNGDTKILIFSVPKTSYALLPENGRAQIQYGLKVPSKVWNLPEFEKDKN